MVFCFCIDLICMLPCPIPTNKKVAARVECNLAKHRHGATGKTTLAFKLPTGEFFTPQTREKLHEPN